MKALVGHVFGTIFREPSDDEGGRLDEVDAIVAGYEIGKKEVDVSSKDTKELCEGVASNEERKGAHGPRQVFGLKLESKHERHGCFGVQTGPEVNDRHNKAVSEQHDAEVEARDEKEGGADKEHPQVISRTTSISDTLQVLSEAEAMWNKRKQWVSEG